MLDAMLALDLKAASSRKELEDGLAPAIPEVAVRQFILKSVVRRPEGGFSWKLGLEEINRNYLRLNEAIQGRRKFEGPALFIRGALSDYLGDEDFPLIEELFPEAELETIAEAGHWVHAEAPEAFVRTVSNFLEAKKD